jgi:hypothetical protein
LVAEVARRHGIVLKEDDPALAIVTLNRLVLQAAADELLKKVAALAEEFRAAADSVQTRAGGVIAVQVGAALEAGRAAFREDLKAGELRVRQLVAELHKAQSRPAAVRWATAGITAGIVLLICGVLLGRLMS